MKPVIPDRILEVSHLSHVYRNGNAEVQAIKDISFTVYPGEIISVVGPSGAGKTTLLRCLSGLMHPTGGGILMENKEVKTPPEAMAFVFQDYSRSLLPWLTVRKNVSFPVREKDKKRKAAIAAEALEEVGLGDFADKFPWQLSGGMQQRVAIARALACKPKLLLMDEPFASVDAQTRSELEDMLLRIQKHLGITVIIVTHDIDESVYLSDRVIVLSSSPTVIRSIVETELSRPRDQILTKENPVYVSKRAEIINLIKSRS